MDSIAIISDVHGNLEALKTVLKDIDDRGIEKIICLGDIIAKGIHQQEVLNLIRKKCCVVIKGNCDEYFSGNVDMSSKSEKEINRIKCNRCKLTEDSIEYLKNLPYCYEFYMSGRLIRLFHATPYRINGFVGNIDTVERLYKLFLPTKNTNSDAVADIVIYGHIHTPFIQRLYNRTIINVGSVGNSIDAIRNEAKDGDVRNTTVANYLIISGKLDSKNLDEKISYEIISLPYDIEKELKDIKDNDEFKPYEREIRKGKYRNMQKIYDSFEIRGIDKEKI